VLAVDTNVLVHRSASILANFFVPGPETIYSQRKYH
jgi:hypothetical protein